MGRLSAFLPRLVALTVAWLLATAALTYAASRRMVTAVKPTKAPVAPAQRKVLVVPDVRRQAYVFAKGMLGDAGFAWRVDGAVEGYAANVVLTQSPAPGTRVLDTGSPTIVLRLRAGGRELGSPEATAPYAGTPIQLADVAVNPVKVPRTALSAKPTPKPVATPKPASKTQPKPKYAQSRPPAFAVPGARPEPLNEMPLPDRAHALVRWLDTKPAPTNANVTHWMYQHQWIVTGARLGWWRGAEALKLLVEADRRVWDQWGIGARSADLARRTLAEVEARSS